MKTNKLQWLSTFVIAAMLLGAERVHAVFTPYLAGVSNGIALYATTLTNSADKAQARLVGLVLKDLSKPSTSVATDYRLFLKAAVHLGKLAFQPPFGEIGSNTFAYFMAEAQTNIFLTQARIAGLNDFVRTKKSASNQVAAAIATLNTIATSTNVQLGLLLGGQVFAKLVAANNLAAIGEANPGFAQNSVIGRTLHHTERGHSGDVQFIDGTHAMQSDSSGTDTYTYTRTGLNTATLVLNESSGSTTTVKIRFTSATKGTFTFRNDDMGSVEVGSGSFTLN